MTESPLDWAESTDGDEPTDRRRQLMIVGGIVGAAVVAGGAFLLLHGGGSSSSADTGGLVAGAHHPAAAAPSAAAKPSAEPAVSTFHGAIGHDPFELPDRIAAALAPPPPAATSTSVKGPSSTGIGTITIPTGTGTTPITTPITTPVTTPGVTQTPVQWLQLLAVHKVGSHWTVDVRTNYGTFRGVKEGATKVGHTYFAFLGEDGALGAPSFVFVVGDSAGGNLIPNANVKPYKGVLLPGALTSTLVLRHGIVDGGVS